MAFRPEPQSRFTVAAGTVTGSPARSADHTGNVAIVFAGLVCATVNQVVDRIGIDAGVLDNGTNRNRTEVVSSYR